MTFTADYPGAIVYPAHPNNYGGYGRGNTPKAIVLHTPEEKADDYESTPVWFANPTAQASTHYYFDNDGDLYQHVPEADCPYANGNRGGASKVPPEGNRVWKGQLDVWPPWAEVGVSLNCQTLSAEIEGKAANIGDTLTDKQFNKLVEWIKAKSAQYGIPLDRDHIIGHFEVATDRTDPGATFPWDRLMAALNEQEADLVDPTKVRLVPVGNAETVVDWTDKPDERWVTTKQRMRIVVDP